MNLVKPPGFIVLDALEVCHGDPAHFSKRFLVAKNIFGDSVEAHVLCGGRVARR